MSIMIDFDLENPDDPGAVQMDIRELNQGIFKALVEQGIEADQIIEAYLIAIWIFTIARCRNSQEAAVYWLRATTKLVELGPSMEALINGNTVQ